MAQAAAGPWMGAKEAAKRLRKQLADWGREGPSRRELAAPRLSAATESRGRVVIRPGCKRGALPCWTPLFMA